jgi:hypothetical protein
MADKEMENWEEYARQKKSNDREIAEILKESLKIVDELSKIDFDDMGMDEDEMEHLETLNKRAKNLKKNKLWKLT